MSKTDISYTRILCPVDFSECSRKAFYNAVGYARHFSAELVILHVSERNMAVAGFDTVEDQHETMARLEAGLQRRLDAAALLQVGKPHDASGDPGVSV